MSTQTTLDISKHLNSISATNVVNKQPSTDHLLIGTHDGSFHCDEALATSLLKLHPKYSDAIIIRSRNPDLLKICNIVVDVGAVYDPEQLKFDHHQREFTGVLDGYHTKLSSAGLVYKHFGKEILQTITEQLPVAFNSDVIDIIFKKIYEDFIEHIDAIDNGISVCGTLPKYYISSTLSNRVGQLNPRWNEPQSPEIYNSRFQQAMTLTCTEFLKHVEDLALSWWPARSIVQSSLEGRLNTHPSGSIMILDMCCPWKEHLFDLEAQLNIPQILYVLYQDTGGSWRIQSVPEDPRSFNSRKGLPEAWRGLRDDTLSQKIDIPGAIFVHASGFIGGHSTKEGALLMAIKAIEYDNSILGKREL
eukprot:gene130-209_t